MSKRSVVKLAVTLTALSAMTCLQGCGDEEDAPFLGFAWAPVGSVSPAGFAFGGSQSSAGGSGQSSSGSVAGAIAGAAGGGGGQVSGGGTP